MGRSTVYEFKLRRVRRSVARDGDLSAGLHAHVVSPEGIAAVVRPFIVGEARECFLTVSLDSRNQVIGIERTAIGTISHVEVHAREVFRSAILCSAACVILCHNHPSGDPKPSDADYELTGRFMRAGELLGIPVMDHVIVTENSHHSIRDDIERAGEPELVTIILGSRP